MQTLKRRRISGGKVDNKKLFHSWLKSYFILELKNEVLHVGGDFVDNVSQLLYDFSRLNNEMMRSWCNMREYF